MPERAPARCSRRCAPQLPSPPAARALPPGAHLPVRKLSQKLAGAPAMPPAGQARSIATRLDPEALFRRAATAATSSAELMCDTRRHLICASVFRTLSWAREAVRRRRPPRRSGVDAKQRGWRDLLACPGRDDWWHPHPKAEPPRRDAVNPQPETASARAADALPLCIAASERRSGSAGRGM
jgi:hypothetical protein